MALNVKPLGDRILVEPAEEKETKKGGIIIPDSAKEKPTESIVVALGTGKTDDDGKKVPFEVKKGDRVLVSKYGGTEIKIDGNISVRPASLNVGIRKGIRLTELENGGKSRMLSLDSTCQGLTRRRFLDLGITPGVSIERVMQSAFHEPTAYRVRGTLIALRREQSDMIWIEKE